MIERRIQLRRQILCEDDWRVWLGWHYPHWFSAAHAPHHVTMWEWVTRVEAGKRSTPLVMILPRGHGKSTAAEVATVYLGARDRRKYALYICGTQEQADDHVSNIARLLESDRLGEMYPGMGDRALTKYGHSRGWRRNRVATATGYIVDAVGLDTASRGVKFEAERPDLMVVDDIDREFDTLGAVGKKIRALTRELLPAGADDLTVLAIQNLVHPHSVFAHLASGEAEFLSDAQVIGPIPAIENLEWQQTSQGVAIMGGTPTWEGMGIEKCQQEIDTIGISAFLAECQHEQPEIEGGVFSHLSYQRVDPEMVPPLVEITTWIDPAVSATDKSDSMGIQIDGRGNDGKIYRLWSWEQVTTPADVIRRALEASWSIGAQYGTRVDVLGIETDQGGDTWREIYHRIVSETPLPPGAKVPRYEARKAGSTGSSKTERASQMLVDYELGRIVHVTGTHTTLERALNRFPVMKPYDLVDAAVWSWRWLAKPLSRPAVGHRPGRVKVGMARTTSAVVGR